MLSFVAFGIGRTTVVFTIVMVVPNGEDGAGGSQASVAGYLVHLAIDNAHAVHVVGVGINRIAQEEKKLGVPVGNSIPDGLGISLVRAGTESDASQGLFLGAKGDSAQEDEAGEREGFKQCGKHRPDPVCGIASEEILGAWL